MTHLFDRNSRRALPFLVAACLTFTGASAWATPNFPGAVAKVLAAGSSPACSLCHVNGRVGRGTVNTPFGASMRARGLVAYDEGTLARALATMESDGVDSDGDGTIDVNAIRAGNDPNGAAAEGEIDPIAPTYGCTAEVAPAREAGWAAWLFFGAFALVLARRTGKRGHLGALGFALVLGVIGGCASGARFTPRGASERAAEIPRMRPIVKSKMGPELRALGLDPDHLPRFEDLRPDQIRGIMTTFTRSLDVACTECHDASRPEAPTRMKHLATRMWNEFVKDYSVAGSGAYCDSCHQGQKRFLRRELHEDIAQYMSDSYVDKLARRDGKAVECETCHGDPAEPLFLFNW